MRTATSVVGLVVGLAVITGGVLYFGPGTGGVLARIGIGTPGTVTIKRCGQPEARTSPRLAGGTRSRTTGDSDTFAPEHASGQPGGACRGDFVEDDGTVRHDVAVPRSLGAAGTQRRARLLKGTVWANSSSPANWVVRLIPVVLVVGLLFVSNRPTRPKRPDGRAGGAAQ